VPEAGGAKRCSDGMAGRLVSERAGRKSAVAAGFLLRRTFEHQNGTPMLGGCVSGTEGSVAGADDNDVGGAGEFGVRGGIHRRKPDIREGRSVGARFHMSTRRLQSPSNSLTLSNGSGDELNLM